jgi:hypothetical protein
MEIIDKVFQVVFARYRRKLGDSNLESAWRRAINTVSGYLVLPVAAAVLVLIAMTYSYMGTGTPNEHKQTGQIIAGTAGVVIFYLFRRRFRKYLSFPSVLASLEARADTRLVFWFRATAVGIFALTCLVGFLLHQAGFRFLQGL